MRRSLIVTGAVLLAAAGLGVGAVPQVSEPSAAATATPEGGPAVMRRLTQLQYRNSIQDIFGDVTLGGRFEPDPRLEHLIAVGSGQATVTAAAYEEYNRMAMGVAGQVVDPARRDQLVPCKPASATAADDACARAFLSKVGRLLFRRPLTPAEVTEHVKIAAEGAAQTNDFYFGLQLGISAFLGSPQFLFVQEGTEPDPARPGARRLDSYAMASRLSFLLWNSTPDDMLLTAAAKGELQNPEGLDRQVDRMLASPHFENGVRAFFSDMLGFDAFDSLAKDQQLYPAYGRDVARHAQEQTLRTIVDHLLVQNGDYRDLFTTRKTFLTPLLASVYRVPMTKPYSRSWEWSRYEMPGEMPQAGILTQISFVGLHSHPGQTSPTLRGKALRELLLCQKVPDPPANVDFSQFESSRELPKTVRERLNDHNSNPVCAGCHKITDPIGLALENFNTVGTFRREDNSVPIDASGTLNGTDFKDATGLGQVLREDPKLPSCLVQRVQAYAVGRPATDSEREWITGSLEPHFATSGYQLRPLLREIATSSGFYRVNQSVATDAKVASSGVGAPTSR